MLLHIDGDVVEIRPGEYFVSSAVVKSRYLEIINKPTTTRKRKTKNDKS